MSVSVWAVVVGLVSLLVGPCDVPEGGAEAPEPGVGVPGVGVPVEGFVSVGVGVGGFGCGLGVDGSVRCWGYGRGGGSPGGRFSGRPPLRLPCCAETTAGRRCCKALPPACSETGLVRKSTRFGSRQTLKTLP